MEKQMQTIFDRVIEDYENNDVEFSSDLLMGIWIEDVPAREVLEFYERVQSRTNGDKLVRDNGNLYDDPSLDKNYSCTLIEAITDLEVSAVSKVHRYTDYDGEETEELEWLY